MRAWLTPRIRRHRETIFVVVLLLGSGLFAVGTAFFVLGVSVGTGPPAPYMTGWDKRVLVGGSLATMALGLGAIRAAGRIVGW